MYEALTVFLERLNTTEYGDWIVDKENDGSAEHPIQFPFVAYRRVVREFQSAVYDFLDQHEELELTRYSEILKEANIEWGALSMKNADVSSLDGKTVVALLVGAIRAERFCDGALLDFFEDGSIVKWLSRLKEIDEGDLRMKHYRIFVSEAGGFRDSTKYEYVAEFAAKKAAANYVQYMFGKKRYGGKDIIIKVVDSSTFDPKDGRVDGVITAIGEELHVEEYEFL